ncbi:uncharacterized protein METZ01_LOCUS299450, partial [marine metagenome]
YTDIISGALFLFHNTLDNGPIWPDLSLESYYMR